MAASTPNSGATTASPPLPPSAPRAVLFDLDGTLVDSLGDIAASCNHALRALQLPPLPVLSYASLAGGGTRRLMARVLREQTGHDAPPHTVERAVDLKLAFERATPPRAAPFDGVLRMLAQLHAAGVRMGVLSNKSHHTVQRVVSSHFSHVPFAFVAGATPHAPLKPDPTVALRMLRTHLPGVAPAECLFVGDTEVDVATALAAGMTPVAVAWGFRAAPQLRHAGAAHVVHSAADICALFE